MKTKFFLSVIFLFFLILSSFNVRTALAQHGEDSVWIGCAYNVVAEDIVTIDITVYITEAIGGLVIPLTFWNDENQQIYCDSIQWSEWFWENEAAYYADSASKDDWLDGAEKTILVFSTWFDEISLAPRDTAAVLATLWFHIGEFWYDDVEVYIDTTEIEPDNVLELGNIVGTKKYPYFKECCLCVMEVREIPVEEGNFPNDFSLDQNYPNPFNLTTHLRFALPQDSWVKIEIFNLLGQRINTLVDENLKAGYKEVTWDGKDSKGAEVASGVYFYRIKTESFTDIKKMVLLK